MCGRFNLRTSPAQLAEFFELLRTPAFPPRFNIAPTQDVLVVRVSAEGRVGDFLRWGLVPSWADSPAIGNRMINARSETAAEKPAFRAAFKKRRCLVPADGFYEWQATDSKTKQPWHIYRKSGEPLAFAGLWETWHGPDNAAVESFTILTTSANEFMARLHDRMPVILDPADYVRWLDPERQRPEDVADLLQPCPADWLQADPISTLVNSPKNDSPECIRPSTSTGSLF